MYKRTASFIFLIVLAGSAAAQDNWNRYSWGTTAREGFSVLLPTIPEQVVKQNGEQGILAFVDFEANLASPNFARLQVTFRDGVSKEEFDRQVKLAMRAVGDGGGMGSTKAEIEKESSENRVIQEISICSRPGIQIGNSNSVQQFFLIDNRLYHVWVSGADESNPNVAKFLESFALINPWEPWKNIRTNEPFDEPRIGSGSGITFESSICQNVGAIEINKAARQLPLKSALRIISKPPAKYPEEAKKNGVQGTVALQITFLRDGSIGAVRVARGINKEINESAVRAAKLIKFEPERTRGKFITVTKTIEYVFTIY